jgi:AIR synthase-related protein
MPPELPELARELRAALGVRGKREIQAAARHLPARARGPWGPDEVRLGDDTAAIPDGEGYLLLAAEGMWPELVASEPRFAAYCAVMVNASDVYAMGGRPIAIVDALYARSEAEAEPLWQGMADAAERFGVPIVGGHTNLHSPHAGLAAAVLGRARRLLTSFDARPGDELVAAIDLRGQMHGRHAFWNATTDAPPARLRADYAVLPELAEAGLAAAAKDVSMGGLAGTALMLLEASGVGATLSLDAIPRPSAVPWATWLLAFPSYGFLLSVPPEASARVLAAFAARDIAAAVVGRVDGGRCLTLARGAERERVWDLAEAPLTGFGPGAAGGGR